MRRRQTTLMQLLERALWLLGGLCVMAFASVKLHAELAHRAAIATIRAPTQADQALWSESRKSQYDQARSQIAADAALAILTIPSIKLEAAVFEGTSSRVLNAGLGRVEGTARVGDVGNLALAGHRDGFFRGLKDIRVGDDIVLETVSEKTRYRVSETFVVNPEEVFVLAPSTENVITLITCYPFYFVGDAPQRFIVRGVMTNTNN